MKRILSTGTNFQAFLLAALCGILFILFLALSRGEGMAEMNETLAGGLPPRPFVPEREHWDAPTTFSVAGVVQGTLPVRSKSLTSKSLVKGPNPHFSQLASFTLDQTLPGKADLVSVIIYCFTKSLILQDHRKKPVFPLSCLLNLDFPVSIWSRDCSPWATVRCCRNRRIHLQAFWHRHLLYVGQTKRRLCNFLACSNQPFCIFSFAHISSDQRRYDQWWFAPFQKYLQLSNFIINANNYNYLLHLENVSNW